MNKSLHSLGASRLLELHLGDDDSTLEDDFQGWREALWERQWKQLMVSVLKVTSRNGGEARSYHVSTVSKTDAVAAERLSAKRCPNDRPAVSHPSLHLVPPQLFWRKSYIRKSPSAAVCMSNSTFREPVSSYHTVIILGFCKKYVPGCAESC